MNAEELVVGDPYFMVTYADSALRIPIVITYQFLRQDTFDDCNAPVFLFGYLPAFQYDDDLERTEAEKVPTVFTQAELRGIATLEGLLNELNEVWKRA